MTEPAARARAILLAPAGDHDRRREFESLAASAGAQLLRTVTASLRRPHPRTFIRTGKLKELELLRRALSPDLVMVDFPLSPAQERNLQAALDCPVVNRTSLILDIFAMRARSGEGKLQVELAQLRHLATRLVGGWTHLERQKGGIGLRGPGETQLETDRRLVAQRIRRLETQLSGVMARRRMGRTRRRRSGALVVSLAGYTNVGKSTLFNRLAGAGVTARDRPFDTLDPTIRRVTLPGGQDILLSDTVGFIRDLPHELVAAFHSTLEEIASADLILHVIDASLPDQMERIGEVERVLEQIGAGDRPVHRVFNKADIMPEGLQAGDMACSAARISALTGAGVEDLLAKVAERLSAGRLRRTIRLDAGQGRLRALLYRRGRVVRERLLPGGGWTLDLEITRPAYEKLASREDLGAA
ncbi:GTPase HflX [Candidatus Foliamicus sp.]